MSQTHTEDKTDIDDRLKLSCSFFSHLSSRRFLASLPVSISVSKSKCPPILQVDRQTLEADDDSWTRYGHVALMNASFKEDIIA
jgi:hypothetical protein